MLVIYYFGCLGLPHGIYHTFNRASFFLFFLTFVRLHVYVYTLRCSQEDFKNFQQLNKFYNHNKFMVKDNVAFA